MSDFLSLNGSTYQCLYESSKTQCANQPGQVESQNPIYDFTRLRQIQTKPKPNTQKKAHSNHNYQATQISGESRKLGKDRETHLEIEAERVEAGELGDSGSAFR